MTAPGFPRPSNLRGEGNFRGPAERHVRALQNAMQKLQGDVEDISTGYRFGGTVYFTSSGTFDKDDYPGLRAIEVELVGGGGAGGNCEATGSGQYAVSGAGGGGAYARKFVLASALSDSETVTVGQGSSTADQGGTSSFGTHCSAEGGFPGTTGAATAAGTDIFAEGGIGGSAGVGDLVIPGDNAGVRMGQAGTGWPAGGGGSVFGRTGRQNQSGQNYGVGGGGRRRGANQGSLSRLSGSDGIVIVHLFY